MVLHRRETGKEARSELTETCTKDLGFGAQACVYAASGSDAGRIKQAGLAGRTVCFGFARDNSHGFEIAHVDSMVNVTRLLVEYLKQMS
jgi:putative aminopeptidase FrvX